MGIHGLRVHSYHEHSVAHATSGRWWSPHRLLLGLLSLNILTFLLSFLSSKAKRRLLSQHEFCYPRLSRGNFLLHLRSQLRPNYRIRHNRPSQARNQYLHLVHPHKNIQELGLRRQKNEMKEILINRLLYTVPCLLRFYLFNYHFQLTNSL